MFIVYRIAYRTRLLVRRARTFIIYFNVIVLEAEQY
jgi:hypothetical protein